MPTPWPKYIIIRSYEVNLLAGGKYTEAFQVANRTGFDPDEGAYWYDTKMVPGKNDPVTLSVAKARLRKLQDQDPIEKERYGG